MISRKLTFSEALEKPDILSITWEMVPGRGAWEKSQQNLLTMAAQAAKDSRIHGITIADNPGGKPAIHAFGLAIEAGNLGIDPIIHFTCKDKNRNDIESELYALARSGVKNLLVMSGDYPSEGYTGAPKPVFDIDSVHTLKLINQMNVGVNIPSFKGLITLKPTNFFTGAVVSPFKSTEAETMNQYYKLHKKIENGAKFIITQLGYDARKFHEVKKYMDTNNINIPLIGNIFNLSTPIARTMNKNGLPGCIVTDDLLKIIVEETSGSKNPKEIHLMRSAKLYAILKGLKYEGINISGHSINYDDICQIIENGEDLYKDWQNLLEQFQHPQSKGFYYFEKNPSTQLNTTKPVDRSKTGSKKYSMKYMFFSIVHTLFFDSKSVFYKPIVLAAKLVDRSFLKKLFTTSEYILKSITNGCAFCGDCALTETSYICPMSKCPKQQRNGACGGSKDGWCEVYPEEKKCIYVTMYAKYKAFHSEERIKNSYLPPCDWKLHRTSSFLNYFIGRDYTSKIK